MKTIKRILLSKDFARQIYNLLIYMGEWPVQLIGKHDTFYSIDFELELDIGVDISEEKKEAIYDVVIANRVYVGKLDEPNIQYIIRCMKQGSGLYIGIDFDLNESSHMNSHTKYETYTI